MNQQRIPTLEETALGAFLHDIGKFMQRALAKFEGLPAEARSFESEVLPAHQGRYTHRHALWTWAFFDWLEQQKIDFPGGLDRGHVRQAAAFHHRPLQQNPMTIAAP